MALFTGDQIYERVAGYGIQRMPIEIATLDYLRKWYIFGWAFRDILADTPSVCMPDDHDVYHGNVWGAGGRHAEGMGQPGQDSGGYTQPAPWVNMMQRTQTSHLPDAFDPTPVEQGIGVYYTSMKHGGIDFAILEDRKWKSAPKTQMPKANIVNGWAQNPDYDAACRWRCSRSAVARRTADQIPRSVGRGLEGRHVDEGRCVADDLRQHRHAAEAG